MRLSTSALLFVTLCASTTSAAEPATFTRTEDVIYGRKYGTALTLDVFKPADPNGLGLVLVVSGGWYSDHAVINLGLIQPFLDCGYTVFAVVHGSQPKFTIPEILEDMHRAVRFVRHHAADYGIDPDRIGIYGASAGGHLSLMQGTAGNEAAAVPKDDVDRASSRVQAVACFFPPTDFLNYGKEGNVALGGGILRDFRAPFDFRELVTADVLAGRKGTFVPITDPAKILKGTFVPITDPAKILEIGRQISPVNHVSANDPPALIVHGDADKLVPIQQAEVMVGALEKAGVEAKLVVREGQAHGWPTLGEDLNLFADWFDKHLRSDEKPE